MRRAFKYRLFTNANQERELAIALETHRRLYNTCLDFRELAYQCFGASIRFADFCRWFTVQRKSNPYYAMINANSAQQTIRRLEQTFANFFRRAKQGNIEVGYPRFKSKDRFNSITYGVYGNGIKLTGNRLRVHRIGSIRVKLHRQLEGKIKTVTLKREADKWFVVFSCDLVGSAVAPSVLPAVGIDLGLTHFITKSDGGQEPNPRYLERALPKLRRACRAVTRKTKGGKNRRKAVKRLQKLHVRVRNLRREHHYQVAHRLVHAHGFIAAESLNIQGMVRNRRLSRAISDAAWGGFLSVLKHKAEKAGVRFVDVDPIATSQVCSKCSKDVPKALSVRQHDCPHCGLSLDRDHNAALNILARGLARTAPAAGNVG